ncbi:transcriptional regulator (plasmid) [Halorubrum sp. BOL3-1]|uniref:HVO_A0114 family putative DNA-binding protein n=1 Tax=Halorubrum sp. BOL3-1 TaxID=2497325 RepID=UPI0010052186|nr:transcriptional regulator [Halorubrum sp. BOL3-1]QAU14539.1 transcriptional regulator [Halorubrum sp. BOL3-1]
MPDESNTNTPDDTDDINSTDPGDEEIVMDDVEAEAGFLEDRDLEDYPSVLRITSDSEQAHRQEALDRLDRWEAGEEVPHVINFQNPSDLRALLTDRRVELLRSIMAERPDSIRQLADRLDRDVKTVHDDLQVLAEYDIVHFEQAGRAKRAFVPYDTIEVSLEISTPHSADDAAPA